MTELLTEQPIKPGIAGLKFSSQAIAPAERLDWLREIICRQYANVELMSPHGADLCQDLAIYPWGDLQLSSVQSSAMSLQRLPNSAGQNAYFAVMLISGNYRLQQDGREAVLQPGDLAIYDATRPHRIDCAGHFAKLIVSIPRPVLRDRIAAVDRCTALRIPGTDGIGRIAANFLHTTASHVEQLQVHEFFSLSEQALDLLALTLASLRPADCELSRNRLAMLNTIKMFIEHNLRDPALDTESISRHAGLSARYINTLFAQEGTSLMRYVWQQRLENCRKDMKNPLYAGFRLADIAFRWGFNDTAHFSRAFKQRFGCSPREFRSQGMDLINE